MKKLTIAFGILSIAILSGCKKEFRPDGLAIENENLQGDNGTISTWSANDRYVPNEVLIKFKAGAPQTGRANAFARIGGKVKEHIVTGAMKHFGDNEGLHLVSININALEAIERIKALPEVEYAEVNWIYSTPVPTEYTSPTDPYYTGKEGQLWGMGSTTQYGSGADAAWKAGHTGSKAVYIGIIDEGIQHTHPDLNANIWTNSNDPVDGLDNDGNGYIDDIHGWDFANNDNSIYDGGSSGNGDDHGTHVAGTIGAEANGIGVIGVNWNVTLISGKFLGSSGGTTASAVKAVDYFTKLKQTYKADNTKGANIIATNNSWGGGGYSQALHDAIIRAAKADILFIAAAGNGGLDGRGDNNDKRANYPSNYDTKVGTSTESAAAYDAVIAVAALNPNGSLASFSNYGAKTVDLAAPGSSIASTTAFNLYEYYGGTSMATPHVTGGAALYAASYPGATALQIKNAIMNAAKATPTSSVTGKTVTGGRLNVSGF